MVRTLSGLCALLLVCVWPAVARADHCPTSIKMPGWYVATDDEAYANHALAGGFKRHPISYLFDRDPATAWVYEGRKWAGRDEKPAVTVNDAFQGGRDLAIYVARQSAGTNKQTRFLVDAIEITNGYAKNKRIYRRNNRIIQVQIEIETGDGRVVYTATLRETTHPQMVRVRRVSAVGVRIIATAVTTGPDNDLCISELQLYDRGRRLIPRHPRYLLYSPGDECGCSVSIALVDRRGRPVLAEGPLSAELKSWGDSATFSPGGRYAAVAYVDACAVADLHTGRRPFARVLPANASAAADATWLSPTRVRFLAESQSEALTYLVDTSGSTPTVHVRKDRLKSR